VAPFFIWTRCSISTPNVMTIFWRGPPTGASNAGRVGKNRDSRPISGFGIDHCWTVACRQHFDGGRRCPSPANNKRHRATHQWIMFVTDSFDVTPDTTEQNYLIVHTAKSEAEYDVENRVRVRSRSLEMAPFDRSRTSSCSPFIVTNNKGLRSRCCTVEATYWQARSIAR